MQVQVSQVPRVKTYIKNGKYKNLIRKVLPRNIQVGSYIHLSVPLKGTARYEIIKVVDCQFIVKIKISPLIKKIEYQIYRTWYEFKPKELVKFAPTAGFKNIDDFWNYYTNISLDRQKLVLESYLIGWHKPNYLRLYFKHLEELDRKEHLKVMEIINNKKNSK